ncbi:endopeptidase La [Bengtsoniella intestinalis]|uniref:endopeptidase La n=1 Tax=Bengtsoniella intestinalis TaxID=3073143 RepID=UPI00391F55D1
MEQTSWNIPVLALRGLTVFPNMNMTFDVERKISIAALERAMEENQLIFLVSQREISVVHPEEKDLYQIGTLSSIKQILRISATSCRVIVEGVCRAQMKRLWQIEPYLQANVEEIPQSDETQAFLRSPRTEALLRQTMSLFDEYATLSGNVPEELVTRVMDSHECGDLADYITQNIVMRHGDKQEILEELNPFQRLRLLNTMLAKECNVMGFEKEMEEKVRDQLSSNHREQIIRTQIRVLQHELGEDGIGGDDEIGTYRNKILALGLPEEAEKLLLKEVNKLSRQPFGSAEGAVCRNYLDVCLEMPWNVSTEERLDIPTTRKLLERDHFGLEKVKERILEAIAVKKLNPTGKGQILCLVGPPGVGKTSIAMSIAKATNRKLGRISLGGVRDEADIRGHRKTYIGSMPGRIIEAINRSGSMNPLLLLDEIDKLGSDHRGDPASALLEVLDGEQNSSFRDHYLEIPVDLSQVFFITTANTTATIPRPLLDRMDVIQLSSYTDEEKLQIAKRHLLPKQMVAHGIAKTALRVQENAMRNAITGYTRESGVRRLERELSRICRKSAVKLVGGDVKRITITDKNLQDFLGPVPYTKQKTDHFDQVGVVNGLAWTQVGGELLEVEVNVMDGTGKLELTGNLGTVMKESVQAAMSCLRSRAKELGLASDFHKTKDIHVHFPEGAVPKDGPSAGIAITTAILSAATGRGVRGDVAMTGEVTLRGRVLNIGGLKEKTMAAKRNGIHTVIIPHGNVPDLEEIDQTVREALTFVPAQTVDDVFAVALAPQVEDVVVPEKPVVTFEAVDAVFGQ